MSNSESSMGAKFSLRQKMTSEMVSSVMRTHRNGWKAVIIANTVPGVITKFANKFT